ncbi:sugar phosphate isomerase/epimerase family protein [Algoriphagus sp.]|uniref:sugar phosphate isomerase/epimerase family protein n=1 Tax=Algoriphagus sp. TaxID=1872435 RepID=UPI0025F6D5EB|nr:sugar phosphate isomerase/epimerase family protein [Algoriphagus sp.]
MIKSSTTIALVPQINYGPWIYWHDLEKSMEKTSNLGFDAIELFTPASDTLEVENLKQLLQKFDLELSAVGTGAGKVIHGLTLTDPDSEIRKKAISFISDMISFGAAFGAPAIIGSMQGNVLPGNDRELTLSWLAEALEILGEKAGKLGTFLIYEPLNRYETNLLNTMKSGVEFLEKLNTKRVKLLADLFHMNIEEADIAESIRIGASHIGHIHFADSNRKPIGMGHTEMTSVASAIKEINYSHYISAEAFPEPNSDEAAQKTIDSFNKYFL